MPGKHNPAAFWPRRRNFGGVALRQSAIFDVPHAPFRSRRI
jgi:hypothetical protein